MHDFQKFPELTKAQLDVYYFESPHVQIFEDFTAEVIKVHDGDTVTLRCNFRDFDFPLRFLNLAAPELKNSGGKEAQGWLENKVLGKEVEIHINPNNRVEKWGRLLGEIWFDGEDIATAEIVAGHGLPWEHRNDGSIPDFDKEISKVVAMWS
jgi:endonuclease YncB( thermonuclease family)